jgi:cyclohexyl-isocyanide hydratase
VQLLAEYDPEPPFDTGSPAKAGDAMTAEIRAHLSKFLAAAEQAVLAASMHTH